MALFPAWVNWVYPRWRGEHFPKESAVAPDAGLSPLARGTQVDLPATYSPLRFIPADAGNTPEGERVNKR